MGELGPHVGKVEYFMRCFPRCWTLGRWFRRSSGPVGMCRLSSEYWCEAVVVVQAEGAGHQGLKSYGLIEPGSKNWGNRRLRKN